MSLPYTVSKLANAVAGADALDVLRSGVIVINERRGVVRWNRAMRDLTGISASDALGRDLWACLPTLEGSSSRAAIVGAIAERQNGACTCNIPGPAGEPVLTLLSAHPMGDDLTVLELEPATPLIDAVVDRAITQRAESEALTQVARALASAGTNLDQSLTLLAEQTRGLLDAEGVCIALLEPDQFRIAVAVGSLAPGGGTYSRTEPTLSRRAITERRVVISNDLAADAIVPMSYRLLGIRQIAVAPMTVEDEVVGVLVAVESARGAFAPGDGSLLQRLADHGALAVRNGQLFQRAEQSAREARALGEIVQRINQSLEVDRVFALIARHAAELLHGRGARLAMLDGDELVLAACVGEAAKEEGMRLALDQTFTGHCIRTGRPAHVSDLRSSSELWTWTAEQTYGGRRNAVAAPLRVGDRTIGSISVFGNDARDFDEHDETLLMALANHAAVAIENARLYRASVRTMRHANILATSARSLALNVTPRAMYADIGRVARTSLRADGVALYLADNATGHVECTHSEGAGAGALSLTLPTFWESLGGAVVRAGIAEFRADIREFIDEPVMQALVVDNVASIAALPLHVEGRPRGLLVLRFLSVQKFEAEQRQLLADFSTHAAVALRNALLFADLERRAGRLAAVAQVQQAISAAVSLDQVYTEIYKAVASVVDAPCFALLRLDATERLFVPEQMVSDGVTMPCAGLSPMPLGDGATSQAFRTGEPNIAARSSRGWTGQAYEMGASGQRQIAVVLTAPIVHGERVLGVIQAQSYKHDAYNWDDVDLTMLIARQAGSAITNALAFEAERRQRQQAEAAADVARAALQAHDVAPVARRLLSVIETVVRSAGSALAVVDATSTSLRIVATRGCADERLGASESIPPSAGLSADAAAAAVGEVAARLATHGGSHAPDAIVPLASGNRVLGALVVCGRMDGNRAEPFTEEEHDALTRLAAPIALAFDTILLREDERRQQARQRMMATALETLDQPVFVYDTHGTIVYANGAATREFQFDDLEMIGLDAQQTMVEALSPAETRRIMQFLLRDGAWSGERLAKRKDGSEFPGSVMVSAIRDPNANLVGAVGIVRNLTEERRVAEQLRQSEKLAALGELVAGVAHEVNNPLTGISALAQLLQDDDLVAEQKESVRLIKREADRAVAVIRDLLTFARKTGPRTVSIDINDLIEQTLRLRNYGLRTAGVTVALTLASNLWRVRGDDRQLQQVLLNLVVNAEHAMNGTATRRLIIRTRNEFDRVVVEVSDTGSGMSQDVQQRIFEPFFTTKPEGKGTGLGLSVSYGIVQTHGGTLTVRSSAGAGATFRVSLPAERPEHSSASQPQPTDL
ncbi:MAG: GAF domain-containing protein [Gemmatimonadaceae bacterium]